MEAKPNPVYKWGEINFHCPHYEECIDHAVKRNWQFWTCSKCPHESTSKPQGEPVQHSVIVRHKETLRP